MEDLLTKILIGIAIWIVFGLLAVIMWTYDNPNGFKREDKLIFFIFGPFTFAVGAIVRMSA